MQGFGESAACIVLGTCLRPANHSAQRMCKAPSHYRTLRFHHSRTALASAPPTTLQLPPSLSSPTPHRTSQLAVSLPLLSTLHSRHPKTRDPRPAHTPPWHTYAMAMLSNSNQYSSSNSYRRSSSTSSSGSGSRSAAANTTASAYVVDADTMALTGFHYATTSLAGGVGWLV